MKTFVTTLLLFASLGCATPKSSIDSNQWDPALSDDEFCEMIDKEVDKIADYFLRERQIIAEVKLKYCSRISFSETEGYGLYRATHYTENGILLEEQDFILYYELIEGTWVPKGVKVLSVRPLSPQPQETTPSRVLNKKRCVYDL